MSSNTNPEIRMTYDRLWHRLDYIVNQEKYKIRDKNYYGKNRETINFKRRGGPPKPKKTKADYLAYRRQWRKENIEHYRSLDAIAKQKRRAANPEKYRKQALSWRKNHRIELNKREAMRRAVRSNGVVTDTDYNTLVLESRGLCGICKCPILDDKFHIDHKIPIARGGKHEKENLQIAHPVCNIKKGARIW